MPTYKLTYFDLDGGRAEPIRIAMHAGGIPFEDERIAFQAFPEAREAYRALDEKGRASVRVFLMSLSRQPKLFVP